MSIAEEFYDAADDTDDDYADEKLRTDASAVAVSDTVKVLGGVEYTTYTFRDRSTLTLGSNGYVGCETPRPSPVIQPES